MSDSESISDFLRKRGALGILTLLSMEDGQRFSDLNEQLTISSSTLTRRLTEARGLGFVVPGMNPEETSVNNEYRITTRGKVSPDGWRIRASATLFGRSSITSRT